jgi:hypothetical protein
MMGELAGLRISTLIIICSLWNNQLRSFSWQRHSRLRAKRSRASVELWELSGWWWSHACITCSGRSFHSGSLFRFTNRKLGRRGVAQLSHGSAHCSTVSASDIYALNLQTLVQLPTTAAAYKATEYCSCVYRSGASFFAQVRWLDEWVTQI